MKTNKFIGMLIAFLVGITFNACVEDGDFTVPQDLGAAESERLTELLAANAEVISIQEVKNLYTSGEKPVEISSPTIVKGYVSSSDRTGNFFREFFIQDKPENPTAALKIVTELNDTYNRFNLGREVYIDLQGLFIGEVVAGDRVITVGGRANTDGEVENLSLNQSTTKLLRSTTTTELAPLKLSFSQIDDAKVGMYVQVDNAQFPENIAGKATFFDRNDFFDTQRTLESCQGFSFLNFILETSSFSSFGSKTLPAGGGSIKAVVSKTFNGRDVILVLNDIADVEMNAERCTPSDISEFTTLFSEDFTNLTTNWTTVNVSGDQVWGLTTFGNPGSAARMNGFSSGAKENEDWLISKAINITGVSQAFVIFDNVKRFDGDKLEMFYATNYNGGNPNSDGTWLPLNPILDSNVNSSSSWTSSGALDVSPAIGANVFIAFKYVSTTSSAATFQIDNFKILVK